MSDINKLQHTVSRMLNTRSTTWETNPEYIQLLEYSVKYLVLLKSDRKIIEDMVREYHDDLDRYKPIQWTITAARIRALYIVARKLGQPSVTDINYVLNSFKHGKTFEGVRSDPVFLAGIKLLEYLYTKLDALAYNKVHEATDNDDF